MGLGRKWCCLQFSTYRIFIDSTFSVTYEATQIPFTLAPARVDEYLFPSFALGRYTLFSHFERWYQDSKEDSNTLRFECGYSTPFVIVADSARIAERGTRGD